MKTISIPRNAPRHCGRGLCPYPQSHPKGVGLRPSEGNDHDACHSAWSEAEAQNPSNAVFRFPLSLAPCGRGQGEGSPFLINAVCRFPFGRGSSRHCEGAVVRPRQSRNSDAVACHSAWSKAQAQNPSMPFTFLSLPFVVAVAVIAKANLFAVVRPRQSRNSDAVAVACHSAGTRPIPQCLLPLSLAPCGRGWFRKAKHGEGSPFLVNTICRFPFRHASLLFALTLILILSSFSYALTPLKLSLWEEISAPPDKDIIGLQLGIGSKGREIQGAAINIVYSKYETVTGLQLSFANFSTTVTGAQIGFFNMTDNMKGVQIGLLNIINNSRVLQKMIVFNACF